MQYLKRIKYITYYFFPPLFQVYSDFMTFEQAQA